MLIDEEILGDGEISLTLVELCFFLQKKFGFSKKKVVTLSRKSRQKLRW